MKKKLLIISIVATISIATVFTGCGSNASTNTTNINQNVFNEATATTDSKKALEGFLKSHANNEVIVNSTDKNEIKAYVNKNFNQYFTSNFLNDTDNQIETGDIINPNTFYLYQNLNSIAFSNDYLINSPTVNKENKTVAYQIKERTGKTYYLQMKQENGQWKIDKASDY